MRCQTTDSHDDEEDNAENKNAYKNEEENKKKRFISASVSIGGSGEATAGRSAEAIQLEVYRHSKTKTHFYFPIQETAAAAAAADAGVAVKRIKIGEKTNVYEDKKKFDSSLVPESIITHYFEHTTVGQRRCKVLAPKCTNVFSCFMFMFWSKRTILTKRLLKAQVCREYETECETQENTSQHIARVSNILAEASACSDTVVGGSGKTVSSLPGSRGTVPVSQPQAKRQTSSSGGGGSGPKIHQVCCGGADSQDESDEDDEEDNNEDELEDNKEDSLNDKIEREARERLNQCKELLKTLKENQLEMLLMAIESCGADLGSCVLVSRRPIHNSSSQLDITNGDQQPDPYRRRNSKRKSRHHHHPLRHRHSHRQFPRIRSRCRRCELHQGYNKDTQLLDESSSLALTGAAAGDDERCLTGENSRTDFLLTSSAAHLLSCQIWRWPDISLTSQLKKLPLCHSTKDPSYVCCNPYHWSRLCKPESPPPPYCLIPAKRGATKCEASSYAIQTNPADTRHCGNNIIVPSRLPESLTTDGEGKAIVLFRQRTYKSLDKLSSMVLGGQTKHDIVIRRSICLRKDHSDNYGTIFLQDIHDDDDDDDGGRRTGRVEPWAAVAHPDKPLLYFSLSFLFSVYPPLHYTYYRTIIIIIIIISIFIILRLYTLNLGLKILQRGDGHRRKEWCTLAYWELGGRVGRLYPVESSTISVFDSLHDGDGLCLASLAENHDSVDDAKTTRSKIGLGLVLSQEDDGVWAYNRSSNPIFVNSPTLDDPESRTLLVYRVPPGSCLNIFDRAKNLPSRCTYSNGNEGGGGGEGGISGAGGANSGGPVDMYSVRISFVKGWGPRYKRQEITSCPCWLEVLLAPCR
ncbi:Similar to SMAD6: Mothers against decapentaplegic homolog 6 (Gallus gallus) [Cotesia congregata]|uniref:Mothers against decapentaplegic homolog n=1 Tax=Cotesia congregata TaxID=51543 RepID=A0A8J2HS39_COTCN|nr:Similar to SMAD6: Mothers against decapentaplegic homolog 6 (Gallus gallus) [Cotesia congregata]